MQWKIRAAICAPWKAPRPTSRSRPTGRWRTAILCWTMASKLDAAQRCRRPADGDACRSRRTAVPHRGAGRRRGRAPERRLLHRGAEGQGRRRSRSRGRAAISRRRRSKKSRSQVEAKDDFGLQEVELHYSVNGGPEKTVAMPAGRQDRRRAPAPSRWKISIWSRATW